MPGVVETDYAILPSCGLISPLLDLQAYASGNAC
jgi:hypothetical protein